MNLVRNLHIISFDNPFPPDYGGVIDVFYKIKALHQLGIKITLHAFTYGRAPQPELENYCEKVYYYKRNKLVNPFNGLPFIVSSRGSEQLLLRLVNDNYPILFEGLHTTYYLHHPQLKDRLKIVRMHNIEHDYYENLKEVESSFLKRIFFHHESKRLRDYENVLRYADKIVAISNNDATYLASKFKQVAYVTAFHPNKQVTSPVGKGKFALYHGKLSVGENDEAAKYLVEKVFSKTQIPLYIAGNNPSDELVDLINKTPNVKLFDELNTQEISDLIASAHINVLPTFQSTGIKLKLINVLYQGRFVLANSTMVSNTGCESLCHIANTPEAMLDQLEQLFAKDFTTNDLSDRSVILDSLFNNETNAQKLIDLIFN